MSKCGEVNHTEEQCEQLSQWKATLMGGKREPWPAEPQRTNLRVRSLSFAQTNNVERGRRCGDAIIYKARFLLSKPIIGGEAIWIPTQESRTVFPLWTLGEPDIGTSGLQNAWRVAEDKIREMVQYDYEGIGVEVARKIALDMRLWLISDRQKGMIPMCTSKG